jgi:hypothetical protein
MKKILYTVLAISSITINNPLEAKRCCNKNKHSQETKHCHSEGTCRQSRRNIDYDSHCKNKKCDSCNKKKSHCACKKSC